MRNLIIVMFIASVFFVKPYISLGGDCVTTLRNCVSSDNDDLFYCGYDGDSFWDTIYDASSGSIASGDTASPSCLSDDSCYIVGDLLPEQDLYLCTSFDAEGFIDCNEYGCVDDSDGIQWYTSSDSEYCCSDNVCTTDC